MQKNLLTGIGISSNDEPYSAGREAVSQAIEKAGNHPDFGLFFCAGKKYCENEKKIKLAAKGAHDAFMSANPKCAWIGCSTAGIFTKDKALFDSVAAVAGQSDFIRCSAGVGQSASRNPKKAAESACFNAINSLKLDQYIDSYIMFQSTKNKSVKELSRLKNFALVALHSGFTLRRDGIGDGVAQGVRSALGLNTAVAGGSASNSAIEKNYIFANGKVFDDAVVCLYVFSNLKFGTGFSSFYEKTKKTALVTKANGNFAEEINNVKASDAYADISGIEKSAIRKGAWLGEGFWKPCLESIEEKAEVPAGLKGSFLMKAAVESPLAVLDIEARPWPRMIKSFTKKGQIEFYTKINEGNALALACANMKKAVSCSADSIRGSMQDVGNNPGLTLAFESIGPKLLLGKNSEKALSESKKSAKTSSLLGIYTLSEIFSAEGMPATDSYLSCCSISFSQEMVTKTKFI